MKYILICGNPEIAKHSQEIGVNTILVDLEKYGKIKRQGPESWISDHDLETVSKIRDSISGELLVRVDPWKEETKEQIDESIERGANSIMLPMIKSLQEVEEFVDYVGKRANILPMIETKEALSIINSVLELEQIEEIFIGLNDLHLSLDLSFMFEPLSQGLIDKASESVIKKGKKFGFGGIALIGEGELKSDLILSEHIRLKSSSVILSRSFHKNAKDIKDLYSKIDFKYEFNKLKNKELEIRSLSSKELERNRSRLYKEVIKIIN
tara:strand:- start:93 stop:893 length:801 start_codon:yes stop_codon:yes gene_type:complete